MSLGKVCAAFALIASTAAAQPAPGGLPPEIGAAYGRLGRAIAAHDIAGVKSVWAEDFVVNAPDNSVLHRDEVIAAMRNDLLDYRDFRKTIAYVGVRPDAVIVMGHDTMIPLKGPGAGKRVMRPFTDVWMRRSGDWRLVARQATIAAAD